ncbi:MAG: carbohydrate kinase family protein [Candidatus Buchananbacteria bacterium]|nr:carbohydrate kinase family protein [Candidatus Buchananbacteria bacterium]
MKNIKILVSGTVAYDQIMNFPGYFKDNILPDKIHVLNVSFYVPKSQVSFGGTAGNIAYNLALLGTKPTILANVGSNFSDYKKWLVKNKIDISEIKIVKDKNTATAYIITDQADNQITAFQPGAIVQSYKLNQKILTKDSLAILAPDNVVNFVSLAKIYRQKKIDYIFDPGQQVAALSGSQIKSILVGAKVFISNDYELSLALKKTGWSLKQLVGQVEILVTTLGAQGSVIYNQGKKIIIPPAKPKNTCDPTGAGDAYRAGLIYSLVNNWPLEKVGRFAGLISVYTVEKYGTQTHRFSWADLNKRYRQNFNQSL